MTNKNTLYIDASSGISGDMVVGALLDLGADQEVLKQALSTVPSQNFKYEIKRVKKSEIDCCDFEVTCEKLQGHVHTSFLEVMDIINNTELTDGAYNLAKKMYTLIAESECKAHGLDLESVHFHEVGSIRAIVEVISAAVCFDNLGIQDVIVPTLYEGSGTFTCAHGVMPIPGPAVTNITQACNIPLKILDVNCELVTPTGCAFVAATRTKANANFTIDKVGYGSGKRDTGLSGFVKMMLVKESNSNKLYKLETNVDDSTGEQLGFCMEELFSAGAREVYMIPCYMKKNRPGTLLTVIATEDKITELENIIFRNTTTLGIRRYPIETTALERKRETIETPYGNAEVKVAIADNNLRVYPEYESVKEIAKKEGIGYQDAYDAIVDAYDKSDDE